MERREKTEFILEQMRLLIAVARQKDAKVEKKDGKESIGGGEAEWVKARVGGRKVNEEFLKEKDNEVNFFVLKAVPGISFHISNQDLKLKYYDLMIQHALHHDSYLDVAKYYYKVWETPSIKEDITDKGKAVGLNPLHNGLSMSYFSRPSNTSSTISYLHLITTNNQICSTIYTSIQL